MSKTFLSVFLFFGTILCKAQTGLFKIYSDYQNGKIEAYEDIDYSKNKIILKQGNNEVSYNTKEIWGFKYKDVLFRCDQDGFYDVTAFGKIIEYSFGKRSLSVVKTGKYNCGCNHPEDIPEYYISSGLNEPIYTMPFNRFNTGLLKNYKKEFKKFQDTYPQHQKFYTCIDDKTNDGALFTNCLASYNGDNYAITKFDLDVKDYGDVTLFYKDIDAAKPLVYTFIFTNVSKAPLKIEKITVGKDFTETHTTQEIPIGGKGEVIISFNMRDHLNETMPKKFQGVAVEKFSSVINVKFSGMSDIKTLTVKSDFKVSYKKN